MSNRIMKEWLFDVFDVLRQEGKISTVDPDLKPHHERSHLIALLAESNFVELDLNARPITVNIKGSEFQSNNCKEILWKKLQERVPKGTVIKTPLRHKENLIVSWEQNLVRYKSTGKIVKDIESDFKNAIGRITETEKSSIVKQRIGQNILRKHLILAYEGQCAMCAVDEPNLLRASHIIPWSEDESNRLNPKNVILLCGLHDLVFEQFRITINQDYSINLPSEPSGLKGVLEKITLAKLKAPEAQEFRPDKSLLQAHWKKAGQIIERVSQSN